MTTAIAYATDDNYAPHVAVSLYSLLKNLRGECPELYVIGNNLSQDNISKLQETVNKIGGKLNFIDGGLVAQTLPSDIDCANLSLSTYIRLFSAQLLPSHIDKLLYLDCDTYINCDINELMEVDLKNFPIAGIEDTMYPDMKVSIGLKADDPYINAGILLINLKYWREKNPLSKFLEVIKSYKGKVPHLDQGVINKVFNNNKVILPLKYNVQSPMFAIHKYQRILKFYGIKSFYNEKVVIDAKKNPGIIHFTSFFLGRPWEIGCIHPLRALYYKALENTPYKGITFTKRIMWKRRVKMFSFKNMQSLYFKLRTL